jgi:hypothetical protein
MNRATFGSGTQRLLSVLGFGGGLWNVMPSGKTHPAPTSCQILWLPLGLACHPMPASPGFQTGTSLGYCGSSLGVLHVPGVFTAKFSRCSRCASISSGSHVKPIMPHVSSTVPFHGSASGSWIRVRTLSYQVLPDCGGQR